MGRDKERQQKAPADAGVETVDNTVDAGTGQRFTSKGDRPTVGPDLFNVPISASDQAYDAKPTNPGPGLRIVIGMFDQGIDTTSITISKVIVDYPGEREAIEAFVTKKIGKTFADDCTSQADKRNADKKKQKGMHIGGGGLDFGGSTLAPTFRPMPAFSTNSEKDSHQDAEVADAKRQEQRSLQPGKDKPFNPIVDGVMGLRNPQKPTTTEQDSINEKIKAALEAGRDGGT